MLVGYETSDDACVYQLSEDLALVQTVDFFPPVVDDPYLFGQIAAANALSDIYAMGATPTLAMNLLCFPACLPPQTVSQILAGGADKVREAGATLAGGHTIEDDEPKYGLCVSGLAHPGRILKNCGAHSGDLLILTKPLGTGILTTAAKAGLLSEAEFAPAAQSMAALNKAAAQVLSRYEVHACTDVTGFGLLGHAYEMAYGSGVTIRLFSSRFPILPKARELAEMGVLPAGVYGTKAYLEDKVQANAGVARVLQDIAADPQTSGGLLAAVPARDAEQLLAGLLTVCPGSAIIGQAAKRRENWIELI